MRFLKPGIVKDFYRGILKRNPTQSDISSFTLDFARNPNLEERLRAMIESEEFQIMVMPNLVRMSAEGFSGRKVFFLHVPKTAGTSVRLALTNALHIPSFNLYPLSTQIPPKKLDSMEFWPYWAGHANISAFPTTHLGFTTFRESRSRILSSFRQSQFNALPEHNPHLLTKEVLSEIKAAKSGYKLTNINQWLDSSLKTILPWYLPNPNIPRDLPVDGTRINHKLKIGTNEEWLRKVAQMSEKELVQGLEGAMPRISAAGWLHQPKGIVEAIVKISGNPDASLPRENEFKKSDIYKEEIISADSLQALEKARVRDRLVFKIATDLGILTDELKIDEDEIFHASMKKLGFRLQ